MNAKNKGGRPRIPWAWKEESDDMLLQNICINEPNTIRAKRAKAIRLYSEPTVTTRKVAHATGFTENAVMSLLKRYRKIGIACLTDKMRSGRPCLPISPELQARILEIYKNPLFSCLGCAKQLKAEGFEISAQRISSFLKGKK